jgi:hypothetical protein
LAGSTTPRTPRRRRSALGAVAATALLAAAPAAAQTPEVSRAELKAAFVLNFVRYTRWPPGTTDDPGAAWRVVTVGDDAVAEELEILAERAGGVAGRRVEVVRAGRPPSDGAARARYDERLRAAHVVFLGAELEYALAGLLDVLRGASVLTVGDAPGFAERGGMIGLVEDGGRMVFDANPPAMHRAGLIVSSRVLRLARIVEGVPRR